MALATLPDLQSWRRATLTIADIADYFQISHETARKITKMPGFPRFQHERTIRIPKDMFVKWVEERAPVKEAP